MAEIRVGPVPRFPRAPAQVVIWAAWASGSLLLATPARAANHETWGFGSSCPDGWTSQHITTTCTGSAWHLQPTTTDPQTISPSLTSDPFARTSHDYMRIIIKSTSASPQLQIFYTSTAHGSFTGSNSKTYNISTDGTIHYFTIPLSGNHPTGAGTTDPDGQLAAIPGWTDGNITQIRVDPSNSTTGYIEYSNIFIRQDDQAPYAPAVATPSPSGWTNGAIVVTATGDDPKPTYSNNTNPDLYASGVFDFGVNLDGAETWQQYNNGYGIFSGTANLTLTYNPGSLTTGAHTLLLRSRDRCGWTGPYAAPVTLYYDGTAPGQPSSSASPSGWTNQNSFHFSWSNPGDAGSGIQYYEWQLDGAYSGTTTANAIDLGMPGVGQHTFIVRAIDNVNNVGAWSQAATVYFDGNDPATIPYVDAHPPDYTAQDLYTFTWPAGQDGSGESGIAGYWYRVDGGSPSFTTSLFVSGALAHGQAGSHTFEVIAQDVAGNYSPSWQGTYFYYYPQWRPTISGLGPPGPQLELPQTFWWNADPQNGSYQIDVSPDPGFGSGVSHFYSDVPWVVIPPNAAPFLGQNYYWRVKDVASSPENWSATATFVPFIAPPPPPGQIIGQEYPSGEAASGVNTALGAVTRGFTLMTVHGPGGDVPLTAWYSSSSLASGFLGPRWTWTLGQQMTPTTSPASVTLEDGQQLSFTASGPTFVPGSGIYDSLLTVAGGYQLVRPSRARLHFDVNGVLQRVSDRNGNALSLAYTSGLLSSFQDAAGRNFTVATQNSRMTQVHDVLGRAWGFEYNGSGYLSAWTDAKGARTQFEYDGSGRLTRLVDPLGHDALRCTYDASGRVATQTDALGKVTSFAYDTTAHKTTVTNPLGGTVVHISDADGRLIADVNERGDTTSFTYDANHNRTSVRDARGNVTRYEYDPRGNVTRIVDAIGDTTRTLFDLNNSPTLRSQPLGKVVTWVNDSRGNPLEMHEPLSRTTTFSYDGAGQVLSVLDANSHSSTFTYDGQGNRATATNGAGDLTTYVYDAVGRRFQALDALSHATTFVYDGDDSLTSETNGAGETTHHEYDPDGNATALVDPRGNRTQYAYDARDRLVSVTDALNDVTATTYDDLDRRATTTDARGATTTYGYDAAGNLTSERDALGFTTTHAYDATRNRIRTTDPRGKVATFDYDALNRLVTTTDPLGHATTSAYDSLGRVVSVTNPRHQQTTYTYDALDRLTSVQAPTGGQLSYGYDLVGNRTSATNANGHATSMTYDAADRLVTTTDPLGHQQVVAYDVVGRRSRRTDARGRVTLYGYDGANRLVVTTYDDSTRILRGYDAAGNLTSLSDVWGSDAYGYDALNRLSMSTDHYGQMLAFAYDSTSNLQTLTYPGGQACHYTHDLLGRVTTVTDWTDHTVGYAYDETGNNTGITYPSGVATAQTFDDAGRLASILTRMASQDTVVSFVYSLDENGNRTQIVRVDRRPDPERAGGPDALATSALLSSQAYPAGADSFVVVSGDRWEEAAGAAPLARRLGGPALVVPGDNLWASASTQAELSRLKGLRPSIGAVVLGDLDGVSPIVEAQLNQQGIGTRRVRGSNRFGTSSAAAAATSPAAVLVGGTDETRLGGAALVAAGRGAPLLMTERDSVPDPVATVLGTLGAANTVLVGDESTIGAGVASWLESNGHHVIERLGSADPSALSVAALEDVAAPPDRFQTLRLAHRDAFQDAVSAAADPTPGVATLLTDPNAVKSSPDLVRWIGRHKGWLHHAVLLGGATAIGANAEAELRNLLRTTVTNYTYNPLDELVSEIVPGVDSTYYTYDPAGNRASVTHNGTATAYAYDGADRLAAAGPNQYTYDGNGNRLTKTNGVTTNYSFDFENRLTHILGPEGASDYRYDGLGRRIRSQEPGRTVRYTIDPTSKPYRTLRESDDSDTPLMSYTFGMGLTSEVSPAAVTRYYHFDGLGSTAAITDDAGVDVGHLAFSAFGDTTADLGTPQTRLAFIGNFGVEWTPSGLSFMRNRFYDSEIGMFVSRDPIETNERLFLSGGYLYAANNPISAIDPDGNTKKDSKKKDPKPPALSRSWPTELVFENNLEKLIPKSTLIGGLNNASQNLITAGLGKLTNIPALGTVVTLWKGKEGIFNFVDQEKIEAIQAAASDPEVALNDIAARLKQRNAIGVVNGQVRYNPKIFNDVYKEMCPIGTCR